MCLSLLFFIFFFFNDTATTEIYTLSLHDALPIFRYHLDAANLELRTGRIVLARGLARTSRPAGGWRGAIRRASRPMALTYEYESARNAARPTTAPIVTEHALAAGRRDR